MVLFWPASVKNVLWRKCYQRCNIVGEGEMALFFYIFPNLTPWCEKSLIYPDAIFMQNPEKNFSGRFPQKWVSVWEITVAIRHIWNWNWKQDVYLAWIISLLWERNHLVKLTWKLKCVELFLSSLFTPRCDILLVSRPSYRCGLHNEVERPLRDFMRQSF